MSKTVSKKVSGKINAANLLEAFKMMGIGAQANARARLYGGRYEDVAINLPKAELVKLGIDSYFNTDIGINISPEGRASLRYDHYNRAAADQLAGLLPGLNQIGAAKDDLQGYLANGFELKPLIDLENEEFGVFLEDTKQQQHLGGSAWDANNNDSGGVW